MSYRKAKIWRKIFTSQEGAIYYHSEFTNGILGNLSDLQSDAEEDQRLLTFYRLEDLMKSKTSSKPISPWINYKLSGFEEFVWDTSQDLLILAMYTNFQYYNIFFTPINILICRF